MYWCARCNAILFAFLLYTLNYDIPLTCCTVYIVQCSECTVAHPTPFHTFHLTEALLFYTLRVFRTFQSKNVGEVG